jgi:hypothetical protein
VINNSSHGLDGSHTSTWLYSVEKLIKCPGSLEMHAGVSVTDPSTGQSNPRRLLLG